MVMFKEFRFTNIQTNLHIIGFTCTQNKSCSVFFIYFFLNVCPKRWLLTAWFRKASAFRTGRMSFQSSASTDEWQLSSSVRRHRDAFSDLSGRWTRHSSHRTRHSSHWTRHSSHWTRHSPRWHLCSLQSSNYDGTAAALDASRFHLFHRKQK